MLLSFLFFILVSSDKSELRVFSADLGTEILALLSSLLDRTLVDDPDGFKFDSFFITTSMECEGGMTLSSRSGLRLLL